MQGASNVKRRKEMHCIHNFYCIKREIISNLYLYDTVDQIFRSRIDGKIFPFESSYDFH